MSTCTTLFCSHTHMPPAKRFTCFMYLVVKHAVTRYALNYHPFLSILLWGSIQSSSTGAFLVFAGLYCPVQCNAQRFCTRPCCQHQHHQRFSTAALLHRRHTELQQYVLCSSVVQRYSVIMNLVMPFRAGDELASPGMLQVERFLYNVLKCRGVPTADGSSTQVDLCS